MLISHFRRKFIVTVYENKVQWGIRSHKLLVFYLILYWNSELKLKFLLSLPISILEVEKKLSYILIFTLICGASKSFIKVLKAFIKPFEAPQRSVKTKTLLNFYSNKTFRNAGDFKDLNTPKIKFFNIVLFKTVLRKQRLIHVI